MNDENLPMTGDTIMPKILVIEDNATMRELVLRALGGTYQMLEAEDGKTGLHLALEHLPDLVICDIAMPGMDGFEVLETLHQHDQGSNIPFIFLTAFGDQGSMRKGMNLGADDYIIKPFTIPELQNAVQTRLRKQATREARYRHALEDLRKNITTSLPHEIRTAIMVIEGYTYLMLEDAQNSPEQREMLNSMVTYSRRLQTLSEKFMWYIRTQVAKTDIISSEYVLNPYVAVGSTARMVAKRMDRSSDLTLELDNTDDMVKISEECLIKIVEELVENAFKFSKPGTNVTIQAHVVNHAYHMNVMDYGRGMTPEQIKQIGGFMQFERDLYEQQGTGLGLIIAKRLTELSEGHFHVHSLPQRGTVVTVKLPTQVSSGETKKMDVRSSAAASLAETKPDLTDSLRRATAGSTSANV
jgi:CheY-like chemotaxis protein/anti-sigma regulatory factor (Ser/Thr protein kinase)